MSRQSYETQLLKYPLLSAIDQQIQYLRRRIEDLESVVGPVEVTPPSPLEFPETPGPLSLDTIPRQPAAPFKYRTANRGPDDIKTIIIHCTGSSFDAALNMWTNPADPTKTSPHYLIDERGNIVQLVELKDIAWHANQYVTIGGRRYHANTYGIGIELANYNHLTYYPDEGVWRAESWIGSRRIVKKEFYDSSEVVQTQPFRGHQFWHKYPPEQIDAAAHLVALLLLKFDLPYSVVFGHYQIKSTKTDPGAHFPWRDFEDRVLYYQSTS